MEIPQNSNLSNLAGPQWRRAEGKRVPDDQQSVAFENSAALEKRLAALPTQRAAEIDRARQLIRDPQYPSTEAVGRIANLLASKLAGRQLAD